MKSYKLGIIKVLKNLFKIFFVFPIKNNRIVFSAYSGKQYSCNPKYISQYLMGYCQDDIEIIWAFTDPESYRELDSRIKKVKFKSLKYIYYVLTSRVVVDNVESWSILPKRKGQLVVNTWHGGGAYKGVGLKRNDSDSAMDKNMLDKNKRISMYISSSRAFTDMTLRNSFGYKGRVMECGMPRNDMLVNMERYQELKRSVKEKTGCLNEKIVLYAPTFRKDLTYKSTLDFGVLIRALEERFGEKWKVLYRGHYYAEEGLQDERITDVTGYPDMQELLLASDVLVTDYSSSMWDFSLMYKPCFLYADDLNSYNNEREFYTPVSQWPFPVAENNEELYRNIICFDNEIYKTNILKHHEELGIKESGRASEAIGKRIVNYMKSYGDQL